MGILRGFGGGGGAGGGRIESGIRGRERGGRSMRGLGFLISRREVSCGCLGDPSWQGLKR